MVNEHSPNNVSRPKNLETLTNNTKMSSTNGEVINSDGSKFDDAFFSSLSNLDLNRLQSQFQNAQPLSMRPTFNNSSSLSPGDSFAHPFSPSFTPLNNLSSSLWSTTSKSTQNQTSSPFNDLLDHRTASPFNDVEGNHATKTNSVGEIGSGLTNGNINNKHVENLFGLSQFPKRSDSRDIWLHGRNASSNFFTNNHNGQNSDVLNSVVNAANSTTKPTLNSSSGLFEWPLNSSDTNNPWHETWSQPFDAINGEPSLETNNKISGDSLEEFKKLLDSNNSNDKLPNLLSRNFATGSSLNTIMSEFEQYTNVSICTV